MAYIRVESTEPVSDAVDATIEGITVCVDMIVLVPVSESVDGEEVGGGCVVLEAELVDVAGDGVVVDVDGVTATTETDVLVELTAAVLLTTTDEVVVGLLAMAPAFLHKSIVPCPLRKAVRRLKPVTPLQAPATTGWRLFRALMHAGEQLPVEKSEGWQLSMDCLLYTSPSPRDGLLSRMPSSA